MVDAAADALELAEQLAMPPSTSIRKSRVLTTRLDVTDTKWHKGFSQSRHAHGSNRSRLLDGSSLRILRLVRSPGKALVMSGKNGPVHP